MISLLRVTVGPFSYIWGIIELFVQLIISPEKMRLERWRSNFGRNSQKQARGNLILVVKTSRTQLPSM